METFFVITRVALAIKDIITWFFDTISWTLTIRFPARNDSKEKVLLTEKLSSSVPKIIYKGKRTADYLITWAFPKVISP